MSTFSFGGIVRAAAIAVALVSAGVAAAPAQAAPYFGMGPGFGPGRGHPYHHFYRHFGPGFGFGFGFGYPAPFYGPTPYYAPPTYRAPICLSIGQVSFAIEQQGYFNVSIVSAAGNGVQAIARRGGGSYAIVFNRCGGFIESARRLRRY